MVFIVAAVVVVVVVIKLVMVFVMIRLPSSVSQFKCNIKLLYTKRERAGFIFVLVCTGFAL